VVREVATGEPSHSQHIEQPGRDEPHSRRRISLTLRTCVAFDREAHPRAEQARVAPWHEAPDGDSLDAGELADAPCRLLIEVDGARARDARSRWRDVEGDDVAHVVAGLSRLEADERRE